MVFGGSGSIVGAGISVGSGISAGCSAAGGGGGVAAGAQAAKTMDRAIKTDTRGKTFRNISISFFELENGLLNCSKYTISVHNIYKHYTYNIMSFPENELVNFFSLM
jgi:hypothetical protein